MVLERKPSKQAFAYSITVFYDTWLIFFGGKWDTPNWKMLQVVASFIFLLKF